MKNKRILSMVLCVVMVLSMIATAVIYLATPIAAADPKKIDKLVVDFRNEAAFLENGKVYVHKPTEADPDPLTGGVYEFDSDMQALRIIRSESAKHNPYRLMNHVYNITSEYKYWVIVYAAETDKPYDVYLHNTPAMGKRVDVVKGAKDTGGKFVVSDPFDISVVEKNNSILKRWTDGNINTINFISEDTDANFYIKEYGFFKSPEDAKAYYAAVDLSRPASFYIDESTKHIISYDEYVEPESAVTATADPVVLKLGSNLQMSGQYAAYYHHGDNLTEGKFEPVEIDGVSAVKLTYAEPTESRLPQYRVMVKTVKHQKLTADHKYMRVTYMSNTPHYSELIILNNGNSADVPVLAKDEAGTGGQWVTSNVIPIETVGCLDRFLTNRHCTFGFFCSSRDEEFYISEIAFFTSPDQAYEYYGDKPNTDDLVFSTMTFGAGGTGTTFDGETYGVHSIDTENNTLDITYAESTNYGMNYMAKIKFTSEGEYFPDQRYFRVLYAADHPEGVETASMVLRTDGGKQIYTVVKDLTDTNGKFVLSDTVFISQFAADRWAGTGSYSSKMHNSLMVNHTKEGGTYKIKAIFFFTTRQDADSFEFNGNASTVKINGTDISKYKIVVAADANDHVLKAADMLNGRLNAIANISLPIVTDDTPVGEYEIILGRSEREGSDMSDYPVDYEEDRFKSYYFGVSGKDVIITSTLPAALGAAVENFIRLNLFGTSYNVPSLVNIEDGSLTAVTSGIRKSTQFDKITNVADPAVFTDDFDTDDGYWQEEYNLSSWKFEKGAYTVKATEGDYSYLHVYEANSVFTADIMYSGAGKNADIAIMSRLNSADAWVKLGYDFELGEWYLDSREGYDFYRLRHFSKKAEIKPDTVYTLTLTVDGEDAKIYVNGELLASVEGVITHITPGRFGLYAKDITATFDNAEITMLSGEGTIMKNTYHTYLNPDKFIAGGTVIELNDGTLYYTYSNTVNLISKDKGLTWQETGMLFDHLGTQPSIIRLTSGELIRMGKNGSNIVFFISSDDGKTWTQTGTVCQTPFRGDKEMNAVAVNMNDKLTQSPTTGRIFYSQNYETKVSSFEGRKVFCEFYYSDDKGYTWTKSETDSWEIEGNEKATHFGECKIIECADGTLRMYNSWNKYGCVIYSESTDNGVTWGPLVKMPEIKCSLSSMQFVRDPYAENDHTYYMVNVYSVENETATMPRSRLSLMRTTDGKNWVYLGDLWRWESGYFATSNSSLINHIVNPFIYVTKDYIYAGCGTSERMSAESGHDYHQQQRQNIWTVDKSTLGEGISLNVFDDVKLTDPAYDAISFVASEGLFNGMSATLFAPEVTMNRAMFVTVLGRLDKADVSAYTTPTFSDVLANQWYTGYVEWAAANGIVNGMGSGVYGVNGTITIEQACTILYRYNGGKSGALEGNSMSDFSDASAVSSWAADGVKWAVENGIYEGVNGKLNPTTAGTRAAVAMMFANYVKAFG